MNFKDKNVWITGASSGIGEAVAVAFSTAGARLILSARRVIELERVAGRCNIDPDRILILPFDMTASASLGPVAKQARERFGSIDILINNAGVAQRALIKDTDISVYRTMMETNFFGPVALTQAVLPSMLKQKSGTIIVIGSPAGIFGTPIRSGYSATKFAVHGFFECLRAEVQDSGVNVSLVVPGPIHTNMSVSSLTGNGKKYGKMDDFIANGITPEVCAQKILAGVKNGDKEIYVINNEVRRAILTRRFLPSIFFRNAGNMAPK